MKSSALCLILTVFINVKMASTSEVPLPQRFNMLSKNLGDMLNGKNYDRANVSALFDELNALPYGEKQFIRRHIGAPLITALCANIEPTDELLAAKSSKLMNNVFSKTQILFKDETTAEVILWHSKCLISSPDAILPEILMNLDGILKCSARLYIRPDVVYNFTEGLIGADGKLITLMEKKKQNAVLLPLMRSVCSSLTILDKKLEQSILTPEINKNVLKYCTE